MPFPLFLLRFLDGQCAPAVIHHALYDAMRKELGMQIIASGGVTDVTDIKRLAAMNLYGAIIGKAYYTKAISIKEAIEVAK